MKKRIVALLLAVCMVVGMVPAAAATGPELPQKDTAGTPGALESASKKLEPMGVTAAGLEYIVNSDHVIIYGYIGSATSLVIPAQIVGLPVTSIGEYAFSSCSSLISISIPSSVTSIGDSAFSGCSSLTNINIPSSVISIGDSVFTSCKNLTSITVDSGNTAYTSQDGILYNKDVTILIRCPSKKQGDFVIPSSVTSISNHAFFDCISLTSINIPSSVTSIGDSAFSICSSLTNITIPNSVTSIGDSAFSDCSSLTSITIPSSVTSIGYGAFCYCSSLTSINIPSSVTSIGNNFFAGCSSLTSISIPSSVTSIGEHAFYSCTSLTSIEIPSSVTSIGDDAFCDCSSLTSINIPSSVVSIGHWAFSNCKSLTNINIPNSVTSIGEYTFTGCSSLTNINIPSSVTSIGDDPFSHCRSLTSITVDSSNTAYSSWEGILYNKNMTFLICCPIGKQGNVVLPGEVTSINHDAFFNCSGLTGIDLPSGVTWIGDRAFFSCSNLTSISIPAGVSKIGVHTFYGCSSLTSISIPSSVTSIGESAICGCSNLSDVYYGGSKSDWEAIYIDYGNLDLTNATIHYADVDTHDTLAELTTEDYLAFSAIAYKQLGPDDGSVQQCLTDNGWWTEKWNKTLDITYGDLCKNIANWTFTYVSDLSSFNGFYAAVFTNDQSEAVIAYRGSVPPTGMDSIMSWDFYCDWFLNDLPMELGNKMGPQLGYAIEIYEDVIAEGYSPDKTVLTGHSLGGAWADAVSACSGSRAETFNAVSLLDVLYKDLPLQMSENFHGVDQWNFVDHANKNDILAGMFEHYLSTEMKPYTAYHGNVPLNAEFLETIVGFVAGMLLGGPGGSIIGNIAGAYGDDIAACHGMDSLVNVDAGGEVKMTDVKDRFKPSLKITNYMLTKNHSVDFGTSHSDTITSGWAVATPRTSYGGDGHDTISANVWADKLIGGRGSDELDGSWGDDTYFYHKGDEHDMIRDVSGNDVIFLYGFSSEDDIQVENSDGFNTISINCNGESIIDIYKYARESTWYGTKEFKIYVDTDGIFREIDITNCFKTRKYGSHLLVGCPVHVEVLDPNGNVVFTLTDGEVGTWYTDYGNFYVFEEENGEYGKVLDLVEGYTARIVGADEGTMDVTYQTPVDGELTEPVSVSGVPVTEELSATFEASEDGDVYLVIDEDGDGQTDSERKLYAECPFTDVTTSDYYYEPVRWAVDEGITSGTSDTEFSPYESCLRSQVVTFLWRAAGKPVPTFQRNPFVDVKPGDYYYDAVLWAVEKGITTGIDSTHFDPNGVCNRSQVVTFLYRAFEKPPVENAANPFTDVPAAEWYAAPVLWAVQEGITNGLSATKFGPNEVCNRSQVVTFLYRAYN